MKYFVARDYGRFVVIHLRKGEKLLSSIQTAIDELGIRSGVVISGIGSLRKADYHAIASIADLPNDTYSQLESPMELGALQGLIVEGKPHLHMVFSDPERAYTGHLEPDTQVQYLAEIAILELLDLDIERRTDDMGVSYFVSGGDAK